jgi:lysophospholipase L1-like esterase
LSIPKNPCQSRRLKINAADNLHDTQSGNGLASAITRRLKTRLTSGTFDAVIDFDKAIRDPQYPTKMASLFDSGDSLHPSDAGYRKMAETIDLTLFQKPPHD